jgi:chromosome segregation ATPase
MKLKVVIVILAVACLGLLIALFATKNHADDQHKTDVALAEDFSNQVVAVNKHVDDLGQLSLTLSNDLSAAHQELAAGADQIGQLSNNLAAANVTLAETKTSLAGAQEQVTNLNTRISDLEAQNKVLDEQAGALSNQLAQLTLQIEDTRNQLAITRTNATFLQGELEKQLAQKAELEHKFNDVDELRAQVKKIRDEMWYARRAQLRNDNGGKKGAEMLMNHSAPASPHHSSEFDLNVEVGSDGSIRVIPPMGGTNHPAH